MCKTKMKQQDTTRITVACHTYSIRHGNEPLLFYISRSFFIASILFYFSLLLIESGSRSAPSTDRHALHQSNESGQESNGDDLYVPGYVVVRQIQKKIRIRLSIQICNTVAGLRLDQPDRELLYIRNVLCYQLRRSVTSFIIFFFYTLLLPVQSNLPERHNGANVEHVAPSEEIGTVIHKTTIVSTNHLLRSMRHLSIKLSHYLYDITYIRRTYTHFTFNTNVNGCEMEGLRSFLKSKSFISMMMLLLFLSRKFYLQLPFNNQRII